MFVVFVALCFLCLLFVVVKKKEKEEEERKKKEKKYKRKKGEIKEKEGFNETKQNKNKKTNFLRALPFLVCISLQNCPFHLKQHDLTHQTLNDETYTPSDKRLSFLSFLFFSFFFSSERKMVKARNA